MIRVACPTCSETREFAAHLAGWEVRCFWCQHPISIPARREAGRRTAAPTRPRRKRTSAGTWAGTLAFGVTLTGVVAAVLIA